MSRESVSEMMKFLDNKSCFSYEWSMHKFLTSQMTTDDT